MGAGARAPLRVAVVAERAHIIRAAQSVKIGRRNSASGSAQIPVTLSARIEEVSGVTVSRRPPRIGRPASRRTASGVWRWTLR